MLGALLVVVDGSRIVWLAVAAATAVPALAWLARHRWSRRKLAVGAVGLGFVLAVLVVTGVGSALLERGLSAATVDWRLAMWAPLAEQWTTQPLAGSGPGSFPWILQLTGYFDTNSWAPRHPDSVFVQTLAEGGLLGIAAVAILFATLAPAILRSRSAGARWALTVFAVAAIGASPTDFAFLLVLALGWTAFALPRDAAAPPDAPLPNRIGRAALITAFAVVALAFGSFSVASFAYERARASVADGELDDSRGAFALARTLDPGLGLYPRQEGAVLLVQGAADLAERRLERAVGINPADDLAWRMLAMARDGQGDFEARDEALDVAIHLQRSDPTNLLLRARWAGAAGRESEAADALAEVVHAWPGVLYAPGWSVLADGAGGSPAVVANAATRWRADRPMPERRFDQGLWIATAADQPNLYDQAIAESPWSGPLSRAALAAMGCDAAADQMLAELPADAQRSTLYWELRARSSALASSPNAGDVRMLELMGGPIAESATGTTLNPLDENGLGRGDRWGYRRQSIAWPAIEITLPSPDVGRLRWMLEPSDATAESGLTGGLGACAP
jgi:tetratricopeptide (TPR) repeat protein